MKPLIYSAVATILTTVSASAVSINSFDANGDRFVSYDEVIAVNTLVSVSEFRDLDINRDHRLSAVELQAPGAETILIRGTNASSRVMSLGDISNGRFVSYAELRASYPGLQAHEFDMIDTNNDWRVSSNEIYASAAQGILRLHVSGNDGVVSLNRVDTDGSGFASLEELQAVYAGTSPNDFFDIDVNRDGRLSFVEFYALRTLEVLRENK